MGGASDEIAREVFAEYPGAAGVIVVSGLPICKPDRSAQKRRLKTVYETACKLVERGENDSAKDYLTTYEWKSPQTVWWCDGESELARVIDSIGGLRHRRDS